MSNRVGGDNNPIQPENPKKEESVDNPEQFKKLLKVEESDETEKREKKPQAAPEEEEEENVQQAQEDPAAGAFSSFMTEEETADVENYQSFTPQSEQSNQDVSAAQFENINTSTLDESATEIENQNIEQNEQPQQTQTQQTQQPKQNQTPVETAFLGEKKPQGPHDTVKKEHTLKNKEPQNLGGANEGKKSGLDTKKTEDKKAEPVEETKADEAGKAGQINLNAPHEETHTEETGKKGEADKKVTAAEKAKSKELKGKAALEENMKATGEEETGQKEEAKEDNKIAFGMQGEEVTQTVKGALPTASVSKLGPTAALKPEILHILQKSVLTIRTMKELGIEKTDVELQMPGSVLDGAKIELSKYAEGVFNVQLLGSPEAVNLFEANRSGLEKALKDRGLEVQLESSRIREKEKAKTVQRKGKSA